MRNRNEEGFTLIELLIVIAIIGILAAIAIPQFNQYKTRAYNSDTKSNLHNLFITCKAYWMDQGPTASCSVPSVLNTTYGYTQSTKVSIQGVGNEAGFVATAQHNDSTVSYTMNSNGDIN